MVAVRSAVLVAFAGVLLGGCATATLMKGSEPFHVSRVNVTRASNEVGTVNLAEDVRVKVMRRVPAFASGGRGKTVDVQLTSMNLKNPIQSLLIGDSNRLVATVTVTDDATRAKDISFGAMAVDDAALQGISGAVLSATDDPIEIEQRLADRLADSVLTQIYGSEVAQGALKRSHDLAVRANYPANYDELRRQQRCKTYANASQTAAFPKDTTPNVTFTTPAECKAMAAADTRRPSPPKR